MKATANQYLTEIVEELAPDLYMAGNKMMGPCPIHYGDNRSGFNITVEADSEWCGRWFCNTQHCHMNVSNDSLGFILSILRHNNPSATLKDVFSFLSERYDIITGENLSSSTINSFLTRKTPQVEHKIGRNEVRKRLLIPARYFLKRGFTTDALDHFDVGLCVRHDSEMDGRVVFPVYDEDDKYLVGCVGRYPQDDADLRWKNSKGFNKANYLYNFGKAREFAEKTSTMVLVEGQGDVIRLWEAGVYNAVGMFGCSLSDRQVHLLCKAGVFNLVLILDSDEAGQNAKDEITEKYSKMFKITSILLSEKDVGKMTVQEVRELIVPQL